jgi:hypothetical protein
MVVESPRLEALISTGMELWTYLPSLTMEVVPLVVYFGGVALFFCHGLGL